MQAKLRRLARLVGTDPGFYVLALHAFVAHFIRDELHVSDAERFPDLLLDLRDHLMAKSQGGFVQGLSCLSGLGRQHKFIHAVRHAFGELESHEAVAATHLFLLFCSLVGIDRTADLRRLEQSREIWNEERTVTEYRAVFQTVQLELTQLQDNGRELLSRLDEYAAYQRRINQSQNQIERVTLELDAARTRTRENDNLVGELRAERTSLREERRKLLPEMSVLRDLETYITNLGRFSVYTKTRMEYERSLMWLTPEQEDAVQAIDRESDFLIRGSAGTGKSLVLIEALKRTLEVGELGFDARPAWRAVFLTYTRTLAKFEDYVTMVLGVQQISGLVKTVDAFILERLRRIDPSYGFDFDVVEKLCDELNTTDFFDSAELAAEIEAFLFGNFVSRDEYTGEVVPRIGMRRRLSRGQREKVWAIRDEIKTRMDQAGRFSRNYARQRILDFLHESNEADQARLRDVGTIYLDETQDLTAGDLVTLKALITGHLIMASDLQQSIYGVSSPFVRAGIHIAGRTRVLRTNFRNTRQIHDVAIRFLPPDEDRLLAFRNGPIPELYTSDSSDKLLELLLQKVRLFLDHLNYDPDNICVLAPHIADVSRIAEELSRLRIPAATITDRRFEFSTSGLLRLSTLHSSKGLDFPVVLVFLPYLNRREAFNEDTTDQLLRNLIYVGFTRAIENLNVFVCPGDDVILRDVVAAFQSNNHTSFAHPD